MIRLKVTGFLALALLLQAAAVGSALMWIASLKAAPAVAGELGRELIRAEEIALYGGLVSVGALLLFAAVVRYSIHRSVQRFQQARPDANGRIVVDADHGDELDDIARVVNEITAGASDIRERKRDEDEARINGEQFTQQVVGAMFDIVIVTDAEMRVVMANRAACEMLGYSKLEIIGSSIENYFEVQQFGLCPPFRQLLLQNEMRDNEMTYRARGGRLITALVSASTLRNSVGEPVAIITVGKDITARKALECDLLEAKIAAEAANRAKSAFVANMSHEIRTPMTAILGYADLLLRADTAADQRRMWLETIGRNGRHLLSIINDILDVSKIEAGKMTTERVECATLQIISDVVALMRERASDKGLKFDVRCTGPIPEKLQSDPLRLRQILINLIGNAVKFTNEGAVHVRVAMTNTRGGKSLLQFSVIDTGIGLAPAQIEALFKPFVQADSSTTRKFGGTGLGLVITRKLVEMLGGEISVRSTPGQGSTFTFTVATGDLANVALVENPDLEPTGSSASTPEKVSRSTTRLSGRVLLAEDGPDNRALIMFHLEEAGLQVETVENGLLAVAAAQEAVSAGRPFDVILMDMQMPELDGYSAATRLRAESYSGPIVALTAHSLQGDREKCVAAGCDDYAVKPIDPPLLFATLAKYLKNATGASMTEKPQPNAHQAALLAKPGASKLLSRFVMGLPKRVAAIESAVSRQAYDELVTLAHQLKGAAGGYGFPTIGDEARALESAANSRDASAIQAALTRLRQSCDAAAAQFATLAA